MHSYVLLKLQLRQLPQTPANSHYRPTIQVHPARTAISVPVDQRVDRHRVEVVKAEDQC